MESGTPAVVSDSIAEYFLHVHTPHPDLHGGFEFGPGTEGPTLFVRAGEFGEPWLMHRGWEPDLADRLRRRIPSFRPGK